MKASLIWLIDNSIDLVFTGYRVRLDFKDHKAIWMRDY